MNQQTEATQARLAFDPTDQIVGHGDSFERGTENELSRVQHERLGTVGGDLHQFGQPGHVTAHVDHTGGVVPKHTEQMRDANIDRRWLHKGVVVGLDHDATGGDLVANAAVGQNHATHPSGRPALHSRRRSQMAAATTADQTQEMESMSLGHSSRAALRCVAVVALVGIAAACTTDTAPKSAPTPSTTTTVTTSPTTSAPVPTTTSAIDTSTTELEPDESPTPTTNAAGDQPVDTRCVRLADFTTADSWIIVNDGVMGGKSIGEGALGDGVLTFSGVINTNGGGFSSVRGAVDVDVAPDATEFRLRVRTDGRRYELQVDDAAADRDPRVTHYLPLTDAIADEWSEVVVRSADAEARTFGVPRDASPLEMSSLVSVGIILSDGVDGPFRMDIDHIDACRV